MVTFFVGGVAVLAVVRAVARLRRPYRYVGQGGHRSGGRDGH
jgi:hypothetical protein